MDRKSFRIFVSGRMIALFIALAFQIVVVRTLPVPEYAKYSFAFAVSVFVQATTSFGIPRLISKYVSQAGLTLAKRVVKQLVLALVAVRLLTCLFILLLLVGLASIFDLSWMNSHRDLIAVSVLYICASALLFDADTMAQALMLQRKSRRNALGEPLVRFSLIAAAGSFGDMNTAIGVLSVSVLTAVVSFAFLLIGVLRKLSENDHIATLTSQLHRPDVLATGIGGYASSLAWFASSPAVVRILASTMLSVQRFAGFGFVQSVVVSVQRYTPGQMLFPFIEPAIMGDIARTSDHLRLRAVLSLVTKIDSVFIGALIVGTVISGSALIDIVTHGKYGSAAIFLPWLLALIVANSCYRSYEITAIALGAPHALTKSLPFSIVWLAVLALLGHRFGIWPLLLCPLGDAATRLWIVQRSLSERGVPNIIDVPVLAAVAAVTLGMSALGRQVVLFFSISGVFGIVAGAAFGMLFIAVLVLLRPLRGEERQIVASADTRLHRLLALLVR